MSTRSFRADDLRIVKPAEHLPIVIGDFVRLASGSPVGIVRQFHGDKAEVAYLCDGAPTMTLPWMCFVPAHHAIFFRNP